MPSDSEPKNVEVEEETTTQTHPTSVDGEAAAPTTPQSYVVIPTMMDGVPVPILASPGAQPTGSPPGAPLSPQQPLEGEELLSALRRQIEYYFSRQNLANDSYLVSKMNQDMWCQISVIAGFPKIRSLTGDNAKIIESLAESTAVEVDVEEMKIRPKHQVEKPHRRTIILREIPSGSTSDELKELFETNDGHNHALNIRSDIGDTWFVEMDSDQAAQDAVLDLLGKQFKGSALKARIKSETMLRGAYAQNDVNVPQSPGAQPAFLYMPPPGIQQYRGGPQGGPWMAPMGPYPFAGVPFVPAVMPGQPQSNTGAGVMGPDGSLFMRQQPQQGDRPRGRGRRGGAGVGMSQDGSGQRNGRRGAGRSRGREGNGRGVGRQASNQNPQGLVLGVSNFPPLPTQAKKTEPIGFQKEYKHYTRAEIAEIIKSCPLPDIPDSLQVIEGPLVLPSSGDALEADIPVKELTEQELRDLDVQQGIQTRSHSGIQRPRLHSHPKSKQRGRIKSAASDHGKKDRKKVDSDEKGGRGHRTFADALKAGVEDGPQSD